MGKKSRNDKKEDADKMDKGPLNDEHKNQYGRKHPDSSKKGADPKKGAG